MTWVANKNDQDHAPSIMRIIFKVVNRMDIGDEDFVKPTLKINDLHRL